MELIYSSVCKTFCKNKCVYVDTIRYEYDCMWREPPSRRIQRVKSKCGMEGLWAAMHTITLEIGNNPLCLTSSCTYINETTLPIKLLTAILVFLIYTSLWESKWGNECGPWTKCQSSCDYWTKCQSSCDYFYVNKTKLHLFFYRTAILVF